MTVLLLALVGLSVLHIFSATTISKGWLCCSNLNIFKENIRSICAKRKITMQGHVKSELVWWGSQRLSVTWLHCLLPPDNRPWTVPALPGAHQVSHFCQIKIGQLFPSATKLLCFVINQYSRNILKLHIIQVPSEANYLIQARWVTGVNVVNLFCFIFSFLSWISQKSRMREVISVHIGQAGVQMGNACWWEKLLESPIPCRHKKNTNGVISKAMLAGEENYFQNPQFLVVPKNISEAKSAFDDPLVAKWLFPQSFTKCRQTINN